MFGRLFGAAVAGAVLLGSVSVLQAQTTPTPSPGVAPTLDSCRDDAIRKGISGDGLSAFLTQCMNQPAQPAGMAGQRASLERCRADAISRNLVGDARNAHIDDCMTQSGAVTSATGTGTYSSCRAQARSQGLIGTQLDEYLNGCVTQ